MLPAALLVVAVAGLKAGAIVGFQAFDQQPFQVAQLGIGPAHIAGEVHENMPVFMQQGGESLALRCVPTEQDRAAVIEGEPPHMVHDGVEVVASVNGSVGQAALYSYDRFCARVKRVLHPQAGASGGSEGYDGYGDVSHGLLLGFYYTLTPGGARVILYAVSGT